MSPGAERSVARHHAATAAAGPAGRERVHLGLGSNLGDRAALLRQALRAIERFATIERCSSIYESEPVGYLDQDRFLNAVVALRTGRSPRGLLRELKRIERALGRRPGGPRFGPRPIDLDLLLYGQRCLDLPARPGWPALAIPHPRLEERAFVLLPLAEIAPALRHPCSGATMAELAARADRHGLWRVAGERLEPGRAS